jgi:hypothetical protein
MVVEMPRWPVKYVRLVGVIRTRHLGSRQVVADDVVGGDIGEHRDGDAPLAVLQRGDDRGGGRPALADDVDRQLDRPCADHHRPGEHRVHRSHRLVRKAFGRSDDRLCEHLRALDHLSLVLTRRPRFGGERVLPGLSDVEEVEQTLYRPR